MPTFVFVRHAETAANAVAVWQGHGDAPLSDRGEMQAAALGARLTRSRFDRVLASDLGRARTTAALAGIDVEPDARWREIDIGAWEGLTAAEVEERWPDEMAALRAGDPIPLGGGESWPDFGRRIEESLSSLVAETGEEERVLVVTHGGVVHRIAARILGLNGPRDTWPLRRVANTSVTQVDVHPVGETISVFNDATHLPINGESVAGTTVSLIRHGESEGNLSAVWQGSTDAVLTDRGRRQAAALAEWYDGLTHLYSSPLARARETAGVLAAARGLGEVRVRPDLAEMHFGDWEGLTSEEIASRYPDEWRAIIVDGGDVAPGGGGERPGAVVERMTSAVEGLARAHAGERVGFVGHGGAIRAYLAGVVGLPRDRRHGLAIPRNTGVSHVEFDGGRPRLVDFNLRAEL